MFLVHANGTHGFFCLFRDGSIANVPVKVPIFSFFCSSFDVPNVVLPFLFLTHPTQPLCYFIVPILKKPGYFFGPCF